MDDEDFKGWVRLIGLWIGGAMAALVALYLIIVAGFAAHAYINQIDPDPPVCVHPQTCQDQHGNLYKCPARYYADDAGHPINLPDPPANVADAGK